MFSVEGRKECMFTVGSALGKLVEEAVIQARSKITGSRQSACAAKRGTARGKELMTMYNLTVPSEMEKRVQLVKQMFKKTGGLFWIEPPVYFAYGSHIASGENVYANCNLAIIDDWEVAIGNNVLFGWSRGLDLTGRNAPPAWAAPKGAQTRR
jgi:hypothetical protein